MDLSKVSPYQQPLHLSPEILQEINPDWQDGVTEKSIQAEVLKVDSELGIVFGWAIVCKEDGEDYYDLQGDHIPEDSMLKAAAEFMQLSRTAGNMHRTVGRGYYDEEQFLSGQLVETVGSIVFAFPLTTDLAKACNIRSKRSGLLIGMKILDKAILDKFKDGTYTGFSIGGSRIQDEVVDG